MRTETDIFNAEYDEKENVYAYEWRDSLVVIDIRSYEDEVILNKERAAEFAKQLLEMCEEPTAVEQPDFNSVKDGRND